MEAQITQTVVDVVPASRAATIAAQNDAFRSVLGNARLDRTTITGRVVSTRAISVLPREDLLAVIQAVRTDDSFPAQNCPYREHDFGSLTLKLSGGTEKVFWKIDYYSDGRCEYGSEDPADPSRTYRVMTIMLAADY